MTKKPSGPSAAGPCSVRPLPKLGTPQAIMADPAALSAINRFEVYILVTMKLRLMMSQRQELLENVLLAYGLTPADGQRVHDEIREALGDEESFFANLCSLTNRTSSADAGLMFRSELWPEFDFVATADERGTVTSARYHHNRAGAAVRPYLPMWSVDIEEFAQRYGPLTLGRRWPLFDEYLPAYEEHECECDGVRYGACFSWGLFMHVSRVWE